MSITRRNAMDTQATRQLVEVYQLGKKRQVGIHLAGIFVAPLIKRITESGLQPIP
jgi:hypothetical protein